MWYKKKESRILVIPSYVRYELFGVESLTRRISQKGTFAVHVHCQQIARQFLDERLLMDSGSSFANIRTVLLLCDATPVVFARTVLPLNHLKRQFRQLARLGNKSLGAVIHSSKYIKMSSLEIARVQNDCPMHVEMCKIISTSQPLWARRSVYTMNRQKLLVNEVLLPEYWRLITKS